MSRILLVGEDELLLHTRAAVVRTTGAATVSCRSSLALTVQEDRPCDLVILCHSLPSPLCDALAEVLHARWPATRILRLVPVRAWEHDDSVEGVRSASSDPETLVQCVVEMLGRRDLASAPPRPPAADTRRWNHLSN